MGLFDRFFGRKADDPQPEPDPVPPTPASPAANPDLIRVFDAYGREMFIAREEWRTSVLPGAIRSSWNDPGQLYGVVVGASEDGCAADVVEAAEHLHAIDPIPARGTCAYGIVLMKIGRLDEAERVFVEHLRRHGEEGVVLTNLAKVHAERNETAKTEETLWRALEADPNQANGVEWYEVMHRERGGDAAGRDALRRVAALPGSWRAQLWLARAALQAGDRDAALALHRETLSRIGEQVPADVLMQISGDLGNHGLIAEILQLTEPHFRAEIHGLQVGNNLIKAHLELGHVQEARGILDRLHALQRPDWREALHFWDAEIGRAGLAGPVATPLQVTLLTLEGPAWLDPSSPAAALFPARRVDGPVIAFLGGTADKGLESREAERQLSDDAGRLSRAIPLFLAEQAELRGDARARTLVPWVVGEPGGFALTAWAWSDDDAARFGREGATPADYVVTSHIRCAGEPWEVELRLLRSADGACVGTLAAWFALADHGTAVRELGERLMEQLAERVGVRRTRLIPLYQLPDAASLASYLLRLEQLLAVRCAVMQGGPPGSLNGEREIVDGNLRLCLAFPHSVPARLLLAQTVSSMGKIRPAVVAEFADRIRLLQNENPLPEPAQGMVERILGDAIPS
jgi:tetratricopeptide (TPR) repeat protein